MQQFSHDYTKVSEALESLYSATRLIANECYDAALQRINNARTTLSEYLAQDNMVPDQPRINGETMQKGVDKGVAVKAICDYYGVGLEDAVAFGDSGNDLPMLDVAGKAVVMGNAAPSVKEHADVVCESCHDNGIAHELERMGLI